MSAFTQGIVLTSNIKTHSTQLELWGGSTKHPDSVFYFDDWDNKCDWLNDQALIFQWLLWVSSRLSFPMHSEQLAKWAIEFYSDWFNAE